MLLWAHVYAPADGVTHLHRSEDSGEDDEPEEDSDMNVHAEPNIESKRDWAAAQAVVEAILEHNDLFLDDIRPEPLEAFHWLSSIGHGSDWTDWREPGTVRLEIPSMRAYFDGTMKPGGGSEDPDKAVSSKESDGSESEMEVDD